MTRRVIPFASGGVAESELHRILERDATPQQLRTVAQRAQYTPIGGHKMADRVGALVDRAYRRARELEAS